MAGPDDYRTIPAGEGARNKARITKAKLGVTWTEFIEQAAEELDPDTDH